MEGLFNNLHVDLVKINESVTLIGTAEDWVAYTKEIDRFRTIKYRHFGQPMKYPCLVFTLIENEDPFYYFEHRFIYREAAQILIDKDTQINNRFSKIANEDW